MKASELRALTRARRGASDAAPHSAPPSAPVPGPPKKIRREAGWPDGRYDGVGRLRLKADSQRYVAWEYRDIYRRAVGGDAEAIERYQAAVGAIGNDNMRQLADRVIGEGEILWNLVGGDREQYNAAKAALMIAMSRLRAHYKASRSGWSYWY